MTLVIGMFVVLSDDEYDNSGHCLLFIRHRRNRVTRRRQVSPKWGILSLPNGQPSALTLLPRSIRLSSCLCRSLLSGCLLVWLSADRRAVGSMPSDMEYHRCWGWLIWMHSRWSATYNITLQAADWACRYSGLVASCTAGGYTGCTFADHPTRLH